MIAQDVIMTTQEVASRLAALCRQGEFEKAQTELFADDAISIEQEAGGGFEKETKGLSAIIEKGHQFQAGVDEVFGITVSEPIVAGGAFALALVMDVKMKGRDRGKMSEICTYVVRDGKVASEQFFM
ncbi:hypothetical protein SAMN05518672_105301 [Chitinophaga sp. CF118]|uniref:SnoaL-like domain-containing protein n=1 Tax=Chitinophaga sp. CF118 TaxID=1884367 RepID=UPI0008E38EFE|nr:SnoaL-like domain-containing protein [Chitinophaga sp. CF118]SFE33107.1 hypothetical protein SAMN05518672_105301 [Chitinophaga sp. CF118]